MRSCRPSRIPRPGRRWSRWARGAGCVSTCTFRAPRRPCSLSIDSGLFAPIFTTDELLAATGDRAWLQPLLDVEAALAGAEADLGLIPAEAATAIAASCQAER